MTSLHERFPPLKTLAADSYADPRVIVHNEDAYLCDDELGLWVVDEANVEAHARLGSLSLDPRFTPANAASGAGSSSRPSASRPV